MNSSVLARSFLPQKKVWPGYLRLNLCNDDTADAISNESRSLKNCRRHISSRGRRLTPLP